MLLLLYLLFFYLLNKKKNQYYMCLVFFFFFLFRNQSDFSSQRKTSRCIKESLKNTYPKLNEVDILNEIIEMEKSVILKKKSLQVYSTFS